MTDHSAASRKGWKSRKRRQAAFDPLPLSQCAGGLDPSLYGPEGAHRGSSPVGGVYSIREILDRLAAKQAAE